MQGFLLHDYADRHAEAVQEMRGSVDQGLLHSRTTVIKGFRQLPTALVKLFQGENIGKKNDG